MLTKEQEEAMPGLIKRSCLVLFALPAAVLAAPVTVTTHTAGTTLADNTILAALGLNGVTGPAPLPYELTLSSTFDAGNAAAQNYGGEVEVDFHIDGQTFHYAGSGNSAASRESVSVFDNYQQHVWFDTPGPPNANFTVHFYNQLYDLPGSMGQSGPLTPFAADQGAGQDAFGAYTIDAYPGNPAVPLSWNMSAPAGAFSVQVAAVPEPAQVALLAAGLLMLGLYRRFAR
jgi:hypothetical protein